MKNEASSYDNAYYHDNVYGHALAILARHSTDGKGKIHLDIGCGFGRIAEPLSTVLGVEYVGVDAGQRGVDSLRQRGFEAHVLTLSSEDETLQLLERVVANRPVHSISFLDTLEHLADGDGDATLRAIGRLARKHAAFVVISTPNVAHRDVGRKLALGHWTYTSAGLLDHTHLRLFDNQTFVRSLRQAGLYTIDTNNVTTVFSDQHFPATHPAIVSGSLLASFLAGLREQADPFGTINQFVHLVVPGLQTQDQSYVVKREVSRPLLSVLIRTQGKRIHTLEEALLCLAGQSSDDFEVLIIGHKLTLENQLRVERSIEDTPEWLRSKIQLIKVDDGNRTRPLNAGLIAASGQYLSILDDDDVPMAHWVETFGRLHGDSPGQVLRAVSVRQNVCNVAIGDFAGLRAEGTLEYFYPPTFQVLDHLYENWSPPTSLAFPRGLFDELGMRFDESLTTTEDWDFLMRAAGIVGVASVDEITSIYRWWVKDESSRTVHPQSEWTSNRQAILKKMDGNPFLLPKGAAAQIRQLIEIRNGRPGLVADSRGSSPEASSLRDKLLRHLLSSSWKVTAPLRLAGRLLGQPKIKFDFDEYDPAALRAMIDRVRRSMSWKLTRPLRLRRPPWWDN